MTSQAAFGQNNVPDPNLQPGWTVQGGGQVPNGAGTSTTGTPSPGYAQTGVTASPAALVATGNGSPGVANPSSNNTSATGATAEILSNPGYGDASPSLLISGTQLAASLVPVPASGTAFANPIGLGCTVVIAGGTVTQVSLTPLGTTTAIKIGAGDGTYTVPAGAQVTLTYSAAPTWTWTSI